MVANKYAFLQITRRRFLNEWEAFKKVISRRNIRRRITIPLTLSNLKLLRRITRTENILHRNFTRRHQGYLNIYNNYFKAPWMPDRTEANPNELNQDDARYGFRCCHLKNIWTAPLRPETELSRQMTTSTTSIDIMGLQAAYANLHTDQERDYFMQRYHDVISSFGGKTSYDADNRPLLVMRSNLWASGYDVDGTDQTSLGQFSGRVQQTYKHSVPRFFVPEHGTMF